MSTHKRNDAFAPDTERIRGRAPTIVDLAFAAGVSKATVSRVLNGSPQVADVTRARVLTAIDAMGFQVNQAARTLRTSRTDLIGVLVPVISVFGRIVEELDRDLAEAGISMLLTASRRRQPERDIDAVEMLVGRGVDALVLAPSHDSSADLAHALGRVRAPIVLLDREVAGLAADAVLVDQGPGITGAMEHLVADGRSRIGLLSRDDKTRPGRQIRASYELQAVRLHLDCRADLVQGFDDLDRRTARDGVDALLAAGVDAIIATGTMEHTATVLERLSELGVSVPRDLALVVYSYTGAEMSTRGGLPTVAYPVDRIAQATYRLLMPRLADPDAPPRTEIVSNVFVSTATGA